MQSITQLMRRSCLQQSTRFGYRLGGHRLLSSTNHSLSHSSRRALKPFPSITISPNHISANGSFAETQVAYLSPDQDAVKELDSALLQANMGVVSHFYMDPELQGTLCSSNWPHIVISDSLAMGDAAVKMVKQGKVSSIACLGVDFMAESVRSVLDMEGLQHIPVYRLSKDYIGCSLAESAEKPAYRAWLEKAKKTPNSLHVVYINTSIVTKAQSHALVPTIACTSSNVVRTILQAFAQVPDLTLWYGPDTYMGENLRTLFETLSTMPNDKIAALHPAHTQDTIKAMLDGQFQVFPQGNCVVHHMFGSQVAQQISEDYGDAFLTAHLEVPGEMFHVSNEAASVGRGVVGSTSNILDFILKKTKEKLEASTITTANDANATANEAVNEEAPLQFVLGTEAGMVTPIVRQVQALLQAAAAPAQQGKQVKVEIVFPVASEAFSRTDDTHKDSDLVIVPGAGGGEGCSAAGGCATCPFMKMNTLDALIDLANASSNARGNTAVVANGNKDPLQDFMPSKREIKIMNQSSSTLGTVPIIHMRNLAQQGSLSQELVEDIQTR